MKYKLLIMSSLYCKAVISGAFLGASLLHSDLWPLVFVGFVFLLKTIEEAKTFTQAALIGLFAGVMKMSISLFWLWSTYPLDWLGIHSHFIQGILITLYWLPAAITTGSGLALFAIVYKKFLQKRHILLYIFGVGCIWMFAEIFGAYIFSLYMMGPGSYATSNFSFGYTGYALASKGLLFYVAMFGGVYALSFFVGSIGALLHFLFKKKDPRLFLIIIVLMVASAIPLPQREDSHGYTIAVINTRFILKSSDKKIPPSYREDTLFDAVEAAMKEGASYILLPEDARFSTYFQNPTEALNYFRDNTKSPTIIVDSTRVDFSDKTVLRSYIYDTRAQKIYFFDKQYLVPQGEYIPYIYRLIIQAAQNTSLQKSINDTIYSPGIPQQTIALPDHIPSVLFCFESVAPTGAYIATQNRDRVPFIAHIVSHAWFHKKPYILWNQQDAMLVTQSRWVKTPIVQSSNEAPIKVYYPNGDIRLIKDVRKGALWSLGKLQL